MIPLPFFDCLFGDENEKIKKKKKRKKKEKKKKKKKKKKVVSPGLEPGTSSVLTRCHNQLDYETFLLIDSDFLIFSL